MTPLGPRARSLLDGGRSALRPTDADRARVEAALRAQLGPGVLPAQGGTVPPPVAAASAWKVAASAVVGAGLVGAAILLASGGGPVPATGAPPASPARAAPVNEVEPAAEPVVAAAPPVVTGEPQSPPPASSPVAAQAATVDAPTRPQRGADRLAEEVSLLSRATRALRAGDARGALTALEEHQSRFPRGVLTEERRAAKAEALCSLGNVVAGRAELARLAPNSPAAARARKACDGG